MSVRRVMIIQRDRGDSPVPPHRKTAPTARAVERAEAALRAHGVEAVDQDSTHEVDFVLVLGGDGTILRASEIARERDVPLAGVNTGHVGFLAEADPDDLEQVVGDIVAGRYTVDNRMTLDVEVTAPDGTVTRSWALNEAALEKRDRARMLEVAVGVDGQAVSSFGCDGLVVSTPTGSTAYAFSGGGPVIWPEVEALLLVPLAAHALFTRPLVLGPRSCLEVVVQHAGLGGAEVWCDGRRSLAAPPGSRIRASRAERPVRVARLNQAPFASRLVRKFDLPVDGWRAAAERPAPRAASQREEAS
nr:NAD kinase [Actinomyces faecalis]